MASTVLVSNSNETMCTLYFPTCIQHLWECNADHNCNCDQVTRLPTNGLSMNTTILQWWPFMNRYKYDALMEIYCNTTTSWHHVKCLTCLFATQPADIDECAAPSTCDRDAECTNTLGSFHCSCNTGYRGNGFTCTSMNKNSSAMFPQS